MCNFSLYPLLFYTTKHRYRRDPLRCQKSYKSHQSNCGPATRLMFCFCFTCFILLSLFLHSSSFILKRYIHRYTYHSRMHGTISISFCQISVRCCGHRTVVGCVFQFWGVNQPLAGWRRAVKVRIAVNPCGRVRGEFVLTRGDAMLC